jgi:hypothetical protein
MVGSNQSTYSEQLRFDQLLAAVVVVGSDLGLEAVLQRIVEAAVGLVDAEF